jgi:hypothetical protein
MRPSRITGRDSDLAFSCHLPDFHENMRGTPLNGQNPLSSLESAFIRREPRDKVERLLYPFPLR